MIHPILDADNDNDHPIKPFYTPQSPLQALLALPGQLLFAITGLLGLAHYARQIVRVIPTLPGRVALREGKDVGVGEWVERNVGSLRGSFKPTWWLPNGHLQTMYSVVGDFTKIDRVEYKRTYLRVPDGGTLGLDFTPAHYDTMPEDTPTVVVCHGLTGGSHESYVRNVLCWVVKPKSEGGLGGRAVVINFRGCAGVPITSPQFYSAGTTLDLALSLHYLRTLLPHSPLHGIGFSLGASVLARYLGESSSSCLLSSGIVLGAPWDLPRMSVKLETHWFISRVYSKAMAANLMRVVFTHYDKNPALFDDPESATAEWMPKLKAMRNRGNRLKQVDQYMVSRFGGPQGIGLWPFEDGADGYYKWASPNSTIAGVKRPTLVVNAFDDPIIDGASLPISEIASSSHVYGAITGGGGHLGWFEGPRARTRWILRPVSEWLTAAYRDMPQAGGMLDAKKAENGWTWVEKPAHAITGVGEKMGGGGGKVGWKVLDEGEVIRGEEGEGVLQGL